MKSTEYFSGSRCGRRDVGLVVAQDPRARQPAAVSPGGIQTMVSPEREPDARAVPDLLAAWSSLQREGRASTRCPFT